jgi:hypothetical protein
VMVEPAATRVLAKLPFEYGHDPGALGAALAVVPANAPIAIIRLAAATPASPTRMPPLDADPISLPRCNG